jgi:hypothetical protein
MTQKTYQTLDNQCTDCGRTNRMCICDPRGGFFTTLEERREYYLKHPDGKGRIRSIPMTNDERQISALRMAFPGKSDDELQAIVARFASNKKS